MAVTISIDDYLDYIDTRTQGTLVLTVTGIETVDDVHTLRYGIYNANSKHDLYLDLRSTDISAVPDLTRGDIICEGAALEAPPILPNYLTNCNSLWMSCPNLYYAPNIPSSAEDISYMFKGTELKDASNLTIPATVTNAISTFEDCTNLRYPPVFEANSALTGLSMMFKNCKILLDTPIPPASAVSFYETYYNCYYIENSHLPVNVTNIDRCCYNCRGITTLSELNVSNSAIEAFYGSGVGGIVGKITIPTYETNSVCNGMFGRCYNISRIKTTVPGTVQKYYAELGLGASSPEIVAECTMAELSNTASNAPVGGFTSTNPVKLIVTGLTNQDMQASTVTGSFGNILVSSAVAAIYDLSECVLPSGLTDFSFVFYNVIGMVISPFIPDGVANITGIYSGCANLKTVSNFPASVVNITNAVRDCSVLTRICDFNTIPTVFSDTFTNAGNSLHTIDFSTRVDRNLLRNFIATNRGNLGLTANYTVDWDYRSIPYSSVSTYLRELSSGEKSIPPITDMPSTTLNSSYEEGSLGYKIRIDTPNSTRIYLRNQNFSAINTISMANAFKDCVAISYFNSSVPVGLENISHAFDGCVNIKHIYGLPTTVNVADGAFTGCSSLANFPNLPNVQSISHTYENCALLETPPVLSDSITDMSYAFNGCSLMATLPNIPSAVVNVDYAFAGTAITTAPTFPNTVTELTGTFKGCLSLPNRPEIQEQITSLEYAFEECLFTSTGDIPVTVTNLKGAFKNCPNMATISPIQPTVVNLSEAFSGCPMITTFPNVPPCVTDISRAFCNCTSLATINDFKADVLNCNMANAFSGCTNLTAVNTPDIQPADASNWWLCKLSNNNGVVSFYSSKIDGSSSHLGTLPDYSSTGSNNIEIYKRVDELVFAPTGSLANSIPTLTAYQYPFNISSRALDPSKKWTVLWADNVESTKSNFLPTLKGNNVFEGNQDVNGLITGNMAFCTTSSASIKKVVSIANIKLCVGKVFNVFFSNGSSASSYTLEINGMSINPKIYRSGVKITPYATMDKGVMLTFMYDGTEAVILNNPVVHSAYSSELSYEVKADGSISYLDGFDYKIFSNWKPIPIGTDLNDLGFGIWQGLDNQSYANAPVNSFTVFVGRLMCAYKYQLLLTYSNEQILFYRNTLYNGSVVQWRSWRSI